MFTYVKLENYKSLVNLEVDLTSKKNTPKNLILIYGENGAGKTNFVKSFATLCETLQTRSKKEMLQSLLEKKVSNPDDENIKEIKYTIGYEQFLKLMFKDIEKIIQDNKTIKSKGNMVLEFGFKVKGKNGVYRLETNDNEIVSEKLEYVCNKNKIIFFEIKKGEIFLNKSIFKNLKYLKEVEDLTERYSGKHSLLSLLVYEIKDKAKGYVQKQIDKSLFDVINYFMDLNIKVEAGNSIGFSSRVGITHSVIGKLSEGKISIKKEDELNKAEELLNTFFTSLYSDIKKVYYKKIVNKNEIEYRLFFRKLIYGKLLDIDFQFESTGTKRLLKILPFLLSCVNRKDRTVVIDEIESGIHDLLMDIILNNLHNSIKGQLIITTHNTLLLESKQYKDNIYVFNLDKDANKELIPLSDFDERIHPNLNIRKKYLGGSFGGVPMPMDVDFEELADIMDFKEGK